MEPTGQKTLLHFVVKAIQGLFCAAMGAILILVFVFESTEHYLKKEYLSQTGLC